MKVFATVMKILAALAAVAGAIYVVAVYGDKIVSWAKNLYRKYGRSPVEFYDIDDEAEEDLSVEDAAADSDAPAEEDFEA